MKRIATLVGIILISLPSFGQYYLSPNGLRTESGKQFDVYEFEGKSQEDLYKAFYRGLGRVFTSPQTVISPVPNELISVNGILEAHKRGKISSRIPVYMSIVMSFEFKDGKVRINTPTIISLKSEYTDYYLVERTALITNFIFTKRGKVYDEVLLESIENQVNSLVSYLLKEAGDIDNEDW